MFQISNDVFSFCSRIIWWRFWFRWFCTNTVRYRGRFFNRHVQSVSIDSSKDIYRDMWLPHYNPTNEVGAAYSIQDFLLSICTFRTLLHWIQLLKFNETWEIFFGSWCYSALIFYFVYPIDLFCSILNNGHCYFCYILCCRWHASGLLQNGCFLCQSVIQDGHHCMA